MNITNNPSIGTLTRKAFLLTTDEKSNRTVFSHQVLQRIGFDVIIVQHIPNKNKVLSNKLSMQYIYSMISDSDHDYSYVFEDDINILEDISLSEIIEYESISEIFFYLGACFYGDSTKLKSIQHKINSHDVISVSGNVFGLHAIGLSKKGSKKLLDFSMLSDEVCMDVILGKLCGVYPANIVRYDLESYISGHRGIMYQDRNKFPSTID